MKESHTMIRKIYTAVILLILSCNVFAAVTPTTPAQGSGTKAAPYQITTIQELWGFAAIVNGTDGFTKNVSACAVLNNDIDMQNESWQGLKTFKGTFDGQGHTISNFYQEISGSVYRSGFVFILQGASASNKAVVKDFTIQGKKVLKTGGTGMHGTVVGDVQGYGLVEDVISEINLTCTGSTSMVGGFTGCILTNGVVNRCTNRGTIDFGTTVDRIGGMVGEMRGGTLSNCLFDGEIKSATQCGNTLTLGGLVGATGNSDGSAISYCFAHGTFNFATSSTENCGRIIGKVVKKLTLTNVYYLAADEVSANAIGTGSATGAATNVTGSSDIWNGTLHYDLGDVQWKQDSYTNGNYPVPYRGGAGQHEHRYDANGICLMSDAYQSAVLDGEYYLIDNGGKLFWFAEQSATQSNIKAKVTADINLANKDFPGIGSSSVPFEGVFDGQGHLISGFKRTIASGASQQGMFNYTDGATVRNFQLEGNMVINSSSTFFGAIVGYASGDNTFEDIYSSVDIACVGTPTAVGGIAGRAQGTFNRCRYDGTIQGNATAKQLAGIVGSSKGGVTVTNCLFDGTIQTTSTTTDKREFRVAGIVAAHDNGGDVIITNCLANGTIQLPSTAPTGESDYAGIVTGTTDLNNPFKVKVTNTYYTTNHAKKGTEAFTLVHGLTRSDAVYQCTERTTQSWSEINVALNSGARNWTILDGMDYPTPVAVGTIAACTYENGFCTKGQECAQCGGYQIPEIHNNIYVVENAGHLFWIANQVNAGYIERSINISLSGDIDMGGSSHDFPGIGNAAHRYSGIFDGQLHTISNFYRTVTADNAGLFNFTEGAKISQLNIEGTISNADHSYVGSVIGLAYGLTSLDEVTSGVNITCSSAQAKYVGGLVGGMGSQLATAPGTIDHSRYKGTITAGSAYQHIGGIVGVGSNLRIENTLFDGTITTTSTNAAMQVAGILAGNIDNSEVTLYKILVKGTITMPQGADKSKSGIVYGALIGTGTKSVSSVYYSAENTSSLSAGPSIQNAYISLRAVTDNAQLQNRYVGTQLGFSDWYLRVGTDAYPLPGELHTCSHQTLDGYGLCSACSRLSPIQQEADGTYLIQTASDFGSFRDIVNSGKQSIINAKMVADVDASLSPVAYIEPVGTLLHPYTGTFDGQGHKFTGIKIVDSDHDGCGFFGYVKDATIKNVSFGTGVINGQSYPTTYTISYPHAMHSPVVGYAYGTTLLEDITSTVNIRINNSSATQVGGIVGYIKDGVTVNRCRFNGEIQVGTATESIGGIVGEANGGIINNCLFDGTITSASANAELNLGGIVGHACSSKTDASDEQDVHIASLYACFAHGTISLTGSTTKSGIVVGTSESGIKASRSYYTSANKSGLGALGQGCACVGTLGSVDDATSQTQISSSHLDLDNWKNVASSYPIPSAAGGDAHQHVYANGYCTAKGSCSARYQQPAYGNSEGAYLIGSGGELMWFMEHYHQKSLPTGTSNNVLLTGDIDMDCANHPVPTFATSSVKYQGIFDGNGHTISGYKQEVSGASQGIAFFGWTSNAEIKNFTLQGAMTFTGMGNTSYFLATVVGNGTNTKIQDVTSSVNMTFVNGEQGARIIGGIAGRLGGTINRCRYNGSMELGNAISQKVAGICASSAGVTISNCLFDGSIKTNTANTSVEYVIIGGIIGNDDSGKVAIDHSLSYGTITLGNSAAVTTRVGAVWGYIQRTESKASIIIYSTANVKQNGTRIDKSGGQNASSAMSCQALSETPNWTDVRNTLISENWHIDANQAYPIPGEEECQHTQYNAAGWCANCNARYPLEQAADGTYLLRYLAQFASYRDLVNKNGGAALNARLEADMHFEWFEGYLGEPMGNTVANKFTGIFDGNNHTISGIHIDCTHDYAGLFGYVENATIKDFTITGKIEIEGAAQYCGSVIGFARAATTIQNIHSSITVNCNDGGDKVIGGIVGRMENSAITFDHNRYSGTINANKAYDRIGGLVGEMTDVTITNSLFDGSINFTSPNTNIIAGGIVGQIWSNATIKYTLSHGSINQSSTKTGAILGYADNKQLTIDRVLYTLGGTMTAAYGTARTGNIVASNGYPWDITSGSKLYDGEAQALLGIKNWVQTNYSAGSYPVPGAGSEVAHTHTYNDNGFCIANDGAYQPAEKALDSYYEIDNAGKLWWIAGQLNSGGLGKKTRIRLTADIDMEGDRYGSFPGICAQTDNDWETGYQGIFEGNGHAIHNYYYSNNVQGVFRRGMFNTVYNATIRNFTIDGTMIAGNNSRMQGVVIGSASGNTTIEDITSSVNITVSGSNCIGGVIGAMENSNNPITVMNRCRYKGTITLEGSNNTNVGGLCGELRSAIIKNCMFDGTIQSAAGVGYTHVGGLVGAVDNNDNTEMHRVVCHGTISFGSYSDATNKSGIVVGTASKTLYLNRCYHTNVNVANKDLPAVGPSVKVETVDSENGDSKETINTNLVLGSSELVADLNTLKSADFRTTLGEPNWAEVSTGYTYPSKMVGHIHKYENGFCTSGDGEYEKPNSMGKTYQVDNGGKLYWFAEHFNNGEIAEDATIELIMTKEDINYIDMEGTKYVFPGIGSVKHKFKGTFDGHGYYINNFHRDIVSSENNGLINYAEDATIKSFSLFGTMNFNLATVKSFHGTVVGMLIGTNSKIEEVSSSVNVNMGSYTVRVFGGIAGRASGVIRRCNYSGTVDCCGSGRQIGGICANAREQLLIDNCMFDGTISSICQKSDTMRVCGILASNEKNSGVKITIQNCLFNGCLDLKHTFSGAKKSTENGIIAGYWDTDQISILKNIYYLSKCDMAGLPIGQFKNVAVDLSKVEIVNSENPAYWDTESNTAKWDSIVSALNTSNSDGWTKVYGQDSTVIGIAPNTNTCLKHDYDKFGRCRNCNDRKVLEIDVDNKYKMTTVSDLASFRDLVNSGTVDSGTELNAKLTEDIDFADFDGDWGEPIGNSHFNRYLYNFDGQGYTIRNVHVSADDALIGLFGFAGDASHDCYIHDFTVIGTIDAPYDSKQHENEPLCMGVVGKMYRGTIENVHSQLTMTNTSPTRANIGGILGYAESDGENQVIIRNCSYSGVCKANAVGNMGGIVGRVSDNTVIENCLFTGTLDHTYQGENNTTQFGGVVGYNESSSFQGVKNCVIAGTLKTDAGREFVSYDKSGNHKNILAGYDPQITSGQSAYNQRYSNNFALEQYLVAYPSLAAQDVKPEFVSLATFASGSVCAQLNSGARQPAWGQILGYQTGSSKTSGSPAQCLPAPGYHGPEKNTYLIVKDASRNYTIDYLYLDDNGDELLLPSDAATIKAKKIEYTRPAKYMTQGFVSACMPFALDEQSLPGGSDCKVKLFDRIQGSTIYFKDVETIKAGEPYFLYLPSEMRGVPWEVCLEDKQGIPVVKAVENPAHGILGSFSTVKTGAWKADDQRYKLNAAGDELMRTNAKSSCYPYRSYLKLPSSAEASSYRLSFISYEEDYVTGVEAIEEKKESAPAYNLQGQRVKVCPGTVYVQEGEKRTKKL